MFRIGLFYTHSLGAALERFALVFALLALGGVIGTNYLDKIAYASAKSIKQNIAQASPTAANLLAGMGSLDGPAPLPAPVFNNVDTSSTASINSVSSGTVVLDPCTGKRK